MENIIKEKINNPQMFTGNKKMTEEILKTALSEALKKIDKLWDDVHGNFASHESENGVYKEEYNDENAGWNNGFWTGMLWLAYEASGEEKYKEYALSHIPSFYNRIKNKLNVDNHDMGFLYVPSCVAAYKLTGDTLSRDTALMAADQLLTRYIEKGGYIQAWGKVGSQPRLIVDCMNNIPLLYWAAEETGDKSYYQKAYNHALATINNVIRKDFSTHHTYYFNEDGTPDRGVTHQGVGNNSCWSRGQAWMISGIPLSYRYTRDENMIPVFENLTNYFLNRLPSDYVPYWDFVFSDNDNEPKDSSASAIAVCGILEMLPFINDARTKAVYEGAVDKIMYSLFENYSTKNTPHSNGLLLHAVYSKPHNLGVDECNIWGCYYYMEALARMIKSSRAYW